MQEEGYYSETAATFGDRLAGAREGAGLSQEALATQLGVEIGTLQAWEDDMDEPRANRLQMLAGMLNVSLSWLLTGRGDGPEAPAATPRPRQASFMGRIPRCLCPPVIAGRDRRIGDPAAVVAGATPP